MKLLLDTHVLIWATNKVDRLPADIRDLFDKKDNVVFFSPVNLWEIAIKFSLRRTDFQIDPHILRSVLLDSDYEELPIRSGHAAAIADLPLLHRDPFDRMLVTQATLEGATLITADPVVARYPGPIRKI